MKRRGKTAEIERYPHWTFIAAVMQPFWHARSVPDPDVEIRERGGGGGHPDP